MSLNNLQYDLIMDKYKARRQEAEDAALERANSIQKQFPEYKAMDERMLDLGSRLVRSMLSQNHEEVLRLNQERDAIVAKKKAFLLEHGFPEDYLEVKYSCMDCKDTGYIGQERCHCFKKQTSRLLYEKSKLSYVVAENNFSKLSYDYVEGEDLARLKKAVSICKNFAQNLPNDYQNLLIYGTVGTGKSFLSGCIAKEVLDRDIDVIYFSANELFKTLSDIMFDRGDRGTLAQLRSDIYEASLLIIDDLGTEITNSAVASGLFSLLNERHLDRRATIISTNLDLKELQDRYADRIFSRLLERYTIMKLTGPDVRRLKRIGSSGI